MSTADVMVQNPPAEGWPALPLLEWQDTCDTLHMWTQIVGKTALELSPLVNHYWNVTLAVSPRGLRTWSIPSGNLTLEIEFDFIRHQLLFEASSGEERRMELYPRSVSDFYAEYMSTLKSLGVDAKINTMPQEFANPIPFDKDDTHASYDKEYIDRLRRILTHSARLLQQFRSRFVGKCSPVHFFWGSFDLAVSRFSGRRAPERPGADRMTRESYSHEVSSCGWWPGDGRFPQPAFYAYSAPMPEGFTTARVGPHAAFWDGICGEFMLKYDDVRQLPTADEDILSFFQTAYEAGANLGGWDRQLLERTATTARA